MDPVTPNEVRDALDGVHGGPGPDGLSWRDHKSKVSRQVLSNLYNLWMLRQKSPDQVKIGTTVLIPKEVGATAQPR